ncbi:MAG: ribosomal protein S18-alanine N-acetyltransferase [Amphiplicatus sp.]
MSRWRVRVAAAEDADALAAIEAAAFGAASWGPASVKEGLSAPYVEALLAFEGRGPQGFALWRRLGDEAEILSLGVFPAARRRGAGAALLDAMLARMRVFAVSSVFLEVGAENEPARALYAKHGFVVVGARRAYYRDGRDAEVMRLDL